MTFVNARSNGFQQFIQVSHFFAVIIQSQKFTVMVNHVQGVSLGQIPRAFVKVFDKFKNAFLVKVFLQVFQVGQRF
jgi:hypothetical protein